MMLLKGTISKVDPTLAEMRYSLRDLTESSELDMEEEFWEVGLSSEFNGPYDAEELQMGVEVEMEHTINEQIAEKIAKDHLSEIPDYYTRLKKMEAEAKS